MSLLVILATILGLVLMHSMVTGEHVPAAPHTMSAMPAHAAGEHEFTNRAAVSATSVAGCGNACEMLCGLMGMACVMVLILSAVAWLRRSHGTVLFVLSRLTSTTPVLARGLIPRRPVSLAALAVYRI
jgi:hypothetical protein